jgi:hypothetical protein
MMISDVDLSRAPVWITPDRIHRVDVRELERFMSALRDRPWSFWKATGHLPPCSVEYALDREQNPAWLKELAALGYVPKQGTLIVDQRHVRTYDALRPPVTPQPAKAEKQKVTAR